MEFGTCEYCGKGFKYAARGKAKYCSSACRQRAYRERKSSLKEARDYMTDMQLYMEVDSLIEVLPVHQRDSFSKALWKALELMPDIDRQQLTVSIIRLALTAKGKE